MKLHITRDAFSPPEFHVWATLDETETKDLRTASESFIVASGNSIKEALRNARDELKVAENQLVILAVTGAMVLP